MSLLTVLGGVSGSQSSTIPAQGVDFDGAFDYLSRATDLTGNVDSKTFTFSAWVYPPYFNTGTATILEHQDGSGFAVFLTTSQTVFKILGYNSAGTLIFRVEHTVGLLPKDTFSNIIVSIDLTDVTKRYLAINDILVTSPTWTYTNDFINFTGIAYGIGAKAVNGNNYKGRLSHLFLDYTYRDLSIEANRRLFITADGKPASGLASLNPILYLPMKDATTAHINEGTGGNMVQNGTLDTAGRGANQDNCVASYFDGVADYLSKTSLTGVADGKQFTLSFNFKQTTATSTGEIFSSATGANLGYRCYFSAGEMYLQCRDSAGTIILNSYTNISSRDAVIQGRIVNITFIVDMDSQANTKCYINNSQYTMTFTTFTVGSTLDFTHTYYGVGARNTGTPDLFCNGNIGELYFDTKYIDLATSNPFWDATENKPKPVRQVIKETGVVPLIAMPLDASNAGKNYGTGGDFTVNSGPYVGARGSSEYWQRTAKFDGSTSYFSRAGLLSITDTNKLTFVANVYKTASILYHLVGTTNSSVSISINASNQLVITAKNSAGTTILSATVTTAIANTTWTEILVSIDLSNTANRSVYLNGVLASVTWTTYTNDLIDYTVASVIVGADIALGNKYNGSLFMMLDNTYVDFAQELNRNKYYDQLGYPKDIEAQSKLGVIPSPALLLNFGDTSALGKNSGYGGDMTINGTIVAGSDVLG